MHMYKYIKHHTLFTENVNVSTLKYLKERINDNKDCLSVNSQKNSQRPLILQRALRCEIAWKSQIQIGFSHLLSMHIIKPYLSQAFVRLIYTHIKKNKCGSVCLQRYLTRVKIHIHVSQQQPADIVRQVTVLCTQNEKQKET